MKKYLFIRELPLQDFIALQDYLDNLFPEIELQSITYNCVKIDGVQKYEVILETQNIIEDNLYINIGLLIDSFESGVLAMDPMEVIETQDNTEIVDKVNIYKSLESNEKERILTAIKSLELKNLDISDSKVNL